MKRGLLLLSLASTLLCASPLFAANIAYDDASDPVYATDWITGDNGGTGFDAWILSSGSNSGAFVGTSDIDVLGKSWGLWANSGDTSAAVRKFTIGGLNNAATLAPGESFLINLDVSGVDSGGTVGFALQNSSNQNRIEFFLVGGSPNYTVNVWGASNTLIDTGVAETTTGLTVQYTQLEGNAWSMQVGATTIASGTTPVSAGDISQVRLFNYNAGNFKDEFYNSMSVVPEPNAFLIMISASAVLIMRRRLS